MNATYLFVAIMASGYIGSRLVFSRLHLAKETQHMFLLGGEYIFLGFILGPSVLNILSEEVTRQLSPILVVGIGWLGLLLGNQISLRNMKRFPASMYKLFVLENFFFLLFLGLFIWLSIYFFPNQMANLKGSGFWLLLAALTATSPTTLSLMSRILKIPLRYTLVLRFLCSIEGLIGIILLGFVYGAIHAPTSLFGFMISGLHWLVIALFLGLLGGIFFHLIVRESDSDYESVLVILGIIIYTGGLAYYLNISALFVSFIIGIVLANLSHAHEKIGQILATTEKPFYIVFLIFAGAIWDFQNWTPILIAILFFGFRTFIKLMSTWSGTKLIKEYKNEFWGMGLGLSSLAGLGLAIALEFYLIKPSGSSNWLLGLVIFLVLINQFCVPIIYKQLLPRLRSR